MGPVGFALSVVLFVIVMSALGSLIWAMVRPYSETDARCDALDLDLDGRFAEAETIRRRAGAMS